MKIVKPKFYLHYPTSPQEVESELRKIELAGRACYKSVNKCPTISNSTFIRNLISHGHLSVIEHGIVTAEIITDRGVTHELVRHRLASYSQESTRYCNYSKDKFGNEISVIQPPDLANGTGLDYWRHAMEYAEGSYMYMLDVGCAPQIARSVLPNSLATTIWVTANFREWLHIFKLRTSKEAHPQIREVMLLGLSQLAELIPCIFGELYDSVKS